MRSEQPPSNSIRKPLSGASVWRALRILTLRDLKVRYGTSALGYLWSILDPLMMSLIYWFIFTQMMPRSLGEAPYIVFLLTAMLPWMWFTGAVGDTTRAFLRDLKLVRSIALPRWVWIARIVCAKGVEFILSLPVLIFFAIISGATVHSTIFLFPLGVLLLGILITGLGLIIAPLVVFFRDLERATKIVLRVLFYASPVIYGASDLPGNIASFAWLNPLSGIFSLFRAGFFPTQLEWSLVVSSAVFSLLTFTLGCIVFRKTIPSVLKEL